MSEKKIMFVGCIKDNNNFGLLKYIIKREDMRQLLTKKETICYHLSHILIK
ncbi:hypothetical protein METP1_02007 [Methanosarcinales archaeon]|nr:hypothetical protein METP1_02007 [Methanosarcinales archaeon]